MAKQKTNKDAEKKTRAKTGHRGSRKNPQDPFALIIQGKGLYRSWPVLGRGAYREKPVEFGSYDMKQALLNRELGLC